MGELKIDVPAVHGHAGGIAGAGSGLDGVSGAGLAAAAALVPGTECAAALNALAPILSQVRSSVAEDLSSFSISIETAADGYSSQDGANGSNIDSAGRGIQGPGRSDIDKGSDLT